MRLITSSIFIGNETFFMLHVHKRMSIMVVPNLNYWKKPAFIPSLFSTETVIFAA